MIDEIINEISQMELELKNFKDIAHNEIDKLEVELRNKQFILNQIHQIQRQIQNVDLIKEQVLKNKKISVWDSNLSHRKYSDYGNLRDYKGNRYNEYNGGWRDLFSTIGNVEDETVIQMFEIHKNSLLSKLKKLLHSSKKDF